MSATPFTPPIAGAGVTARPPLWELPIAISVSSNDDLPGLGYSSIHLEDLSTEIARHLLISGAHLIYGGDTRATGAGKMVEIFSQLAYQYRSRDDNRQYYFTSYFHYPSYLALDAVKLRAFKMNRTAIVNVPPPDWPGVDPQQMIARDTLEHRAIRARSITDMRIRMVAESRGRIVAGGKTCDYGGRVPGILEEGIFSLQANQPVYIIGAMGGAARELARAIEGHGFSFPANSFHCCDGYKEFVAYYNTRDAANPIHPDQMASWCADYGIERLAANNGLSVEENRRLFVTPHIPEMLFYIFKGLHCLTKCK